MTGHDRIAYKARQRIGKIIAQERGQTRRLDRG